MTLILSCTHGPMTAVVYYDRCLLRVFAGIHSLAIKDMTGVNGTVTDP